MSRIEHVLDFWFSPENEPFWFAGDKQFDDRVALRLGDLSRLAFAGALDGWRGSPRGALALVLLLDQVPRNLHRGTAQAFAGDASALEVAEEAVDRGFDRGLRQKERLFLYLPFEHSETLGAQERSCALIAALDENPDWLQYAVWHKVIIERFGRFPHRNEALGRITTTEEMDFLANDPHASF
ncbi:DUF924 family protein [Limibacillus halophilus]|uniref:Uncharacterized protein (DUF924 family) n=1 Tax=Limibacillus halophilus TaxID=1579333 RepID=A0A839ST53_9PROT|nr:DUF924 family protein [Limibacillus halophilus]MBB3065981.1 uncharacterized protein (DUF924 family) [Limibacillus halophilus]